MGVFMSHAQKPTAQQAEILQDFSKFAKTEERPPMTVEHQTYDYKQTEEEQDEELVAIVCCPHSIGYNPDKIALIDIDETSETFGEIINEIYLPSRGDEPGRINWTKSAEFLSDMRKLKRRHLVIPCMNTNRIYIIAYENKAFKIEKVIQSDDLLRKDVSCPYAVRALPLKGAPMHISTLGDKNGHSKGDFILIDRNTWEIRQKKDHQFSNMGGDFGLQPRHNILISCEWGPPRLFRDGLSASDLENVSESFGTCLYVWQIFPPVLKQTIELGPYNGCLISAIRFLHNGDCNHAFACSAIGSSIFHIHMNSLTKTWNADKVVSIPSLRVEEWQSDEMPALLTDMVISLDDRWLYVCGFLHGVVWRFDIQDPFRVTLYDKINLGGVPYHFPDIRIKSSTALEDRWWLPPENRSLPRDVPFRGGPGMLQLSKDGNRLYVCNSFYKAWDAQFYPELISDGGQMVRIDVAENKMELNQKFLIDMKNQANGPYALRDIRFIDGDCTSDTFL